MAAPISWSTTSAGSPELRIGGFLSVSDEEWLQNFEFNVMTAVRACRAVLPIMLEQGSGAIVNVSSINARLPQPPVVDYSAAKAALMNLTKALSEEFSPRGVRVNSVLPGMIRTPLWEGEGRIGEQMARTMGVELHELIEQTLPKAAGVTLGRMAQPEEIAAVVVMLASPRGSAITGSDFVIDCGMNKSL